MSAVRLWFERRGGGVAVLVVLGLLAVSCSASVAVEAEGGDSAGSGSAAWGEGLDESSFAPEVVAAVDALTAVHGDDVLVVLLYTLERGYSSDQLAWGAAGGVIDGDGSFADGTTPDGNAAGVVLLPDGEGEGEGEGAWGLRLEGSDLVLKPAVSRSQSTDDGPLMVDLLRQQFGTAGNAPDRVLALAIVGLARDGYSLEQITDAIVLGTAFPRPTRNFEERHVCLFDVNGALIKPLVFIGVDPICADETIGRLSTDEAVDEESGDPSTEAAETTADAPAGDTENDSADLDVDGIYRGEFDSAAYFATFQDAGEIVANSASMVIESGTITSFEATFHTLDDGAANNVCPFETVVDLVGRPDTAGRSGNTLTIDVDAVVENRYPAGPPGCGEEDPIITADSVAISVEIGETAAAFGFFDGLLVAELKRE